MRQLIWHRHVVKPAHTVAPPFIQGVSLFHLQECRQKPPSAATDEHACDARKLPREPAHACMRVRIWGWRVLTRCCLGLGTVRVWRM